MTSSLLRKLAYSRTDNTLSVLVEKHAPMKTLSKRKLKQFSKPWITIGLKKSIRVKNSLFQSGNFAQYKLYRNKISALTRVSKKNYYYAFFADNLNNMKNTWNGINSLINGKKKKSRAISSLKRLNNGITTDPLEISKFFNNYFSSVGVAWVSGVSEGKGERWKRKRKRAEGEKHLTQMFLLEPSTPTQHDSIPSNQNHLRSGRAPVLVLLRFRFFLKPLMRSFRILVMENLPFLRNYNMF